MTEEELIRDIEGLRRLLRDKEDNLAQLRREKVIIQNNGLSNEEIARYSRQILMPEVGVKGNFLMILVLVYEGEAEMVKRVEHLIFDIFTGEISEGRTIIKDMQVVGYQQLCTVSKNHIFESF